MPHRKEANYAVLRMTSKVDATSLQTFLDTLEDSIDIVVISVDDTICYVTDGRAHQAFDGFDNFTIDSPDAEITAVCGSNLLSVDRAGISALNKIDLFRHDDEKPGGQ